VFTQKPTGRALYFGLQRKKKKRKNKKKKEKFKPREIMRGKSNFCERGG
jgi:hypothetical protein